MKLIFMGTSQFAVPTLNRLLENRQHQIIAVYTRAPKPAGRGNNLILSPIHQIALEHNLPIFTPATLNNKESQQEFIKLNADIAIVVSYGLILPEEIIKSGNPSLSQACSNFLSICIGFKASRELGNKLQKLYFIC